MALRHFLGASRIQQERIPIVSALDKLTDFEYIRSFAPDITLISNLQSWEITPQKSNITVFLSKLRQFLQHPLGLLRVILENKRPPERAFDGNAEIEDFIHFKITLRMGFAEAGKLTQPQHEP